ncbi:hypothetical protein HW555_004343 [Spodoptera exigua]|uniref:Uncharacterized protein n=1 Tax=Spodoptera exigua TaxID=7107 RepID=A0A835L8G9_SPOEX|nr:hypothetical protein HW555_004343 [Spodoptera exigua]
MDTYLNKTWEARRYCQLLAPARVRIERGGEAASVGARRLEVLRASRRAPNSRSGARGVALT